jgi:hypothetical protein
VEIRTFVLLLAIYFILNFRHQNIFLHYSSYYRDTTLPRATLPRSSARKIENEGKDESEGKGKSEGEGESENDAFESEYCVRICIERKCRSTNIPSLAIIFNTAILFTTLPKTI